MTPKTCSYFIVKLALLLLIAPTIQSQNNKVLDSLYTNVTDSLEFRKITDSLLIRQAHYMSKNLDSVIFYTKVGVRFSNKIDYDEGVRRLYTNLGIEYVQQRKIEDAILVLEDALDYSMKVGAPKTIAQAYSNLGVCYIMSNNYYKTLSYYNEGIHYLKDIKDADEQEALLTYNTAIIHYLIKDYDNALLKLKEVEKLYRDQDDKFQLVNTLNLYGNIYLEKEDFNMTHNYFGQALEIAKKVEDKHENVFYVIDTYINYLRYYLETKDFDNILPTIDIIETLNSNYKENNEFNSVINYAKARVYFYKSDFFKSKTYALLAQKQSKNADLELVFDVNQLLLDLATIENKEDEINKYASLTLQLKDSLYKDQNDMLFHKEQVAFEINKAELNQIKERVKIEEEQLKTDRLFNNSLVLGASIFSLMLGLIWLKERNILKSKNNQLQLVKEKIGLEKYAEEIEENLSKDLHDNFGSNIVGVISAHQILLDINNKTNISDKSFNKFSNIIQEELLPLTNDIKDLIWASNKSNNTLDATLKRLNELIQEKYKNTAIDISNLVTVTDLKLPKFTNKQILVLVREILTEVIRTYDLNNITITTCIEANKELHVKIMFAIKIDIQEKLNLLAQMELISEKAKLWGFDFSMHNNDNLEVILKREVILTALSNENFNIEIQKL